MMRTAPPSLSIWARFGRHLAGQLGHVLNPFWAAAMRARPVAGHSAAQREGRGSRGAFRALHRRARLDDPGDVMCEAEADIQRRVLLVIGDQLGVDGVEVWLDARLVEDFGADSLDVAELLVALEEEFGTAIDQDGVNDVTTVEEAIMCVLRTFDWIDEGEVREATVALDLTLDPVELPPVARTKRLADAA